MRPATCSSPVRMGEEVKPSPSTASILGRCFWAGISPEGEVFEEDFIAKRRKHRKHHHVYGGPGPLKSKETPLKGFNPYFTPGKLRHGNVSETEGSQALFLCKHWRILGCRWDLAPSLTLLPSSCRARNKTNASLPIHTLLGQPP